MGHYPSKLCCLLKIVILLGHGMIDCVIGGQIVSAVGDGSISTAVGIVIVAVIYPKDISFPFILGHWIGPSGRTHINYPSELPP